jgi:hypothetical protein
LAAVVVPTVRAEAWAQELEVRIVPAAERARERAARIDLAAELVLQRDLPVAAQAHRLVHPAAAVVQTALVIEAFHPVVAAMRLVAVAAVVPRAQPVRAAEVAWAVAGLVVAADVVWVAAAGAAAVAVEDAVAAVEDAVAAVEDVDVKNSRGKTNEIKINHYDLNKNFSNRSRANFRCRSCAERSAGSEKRSGARGFSAKTIQYSERGSRRVNCSGRIF